ncbi:zinc finger and BTB domain-containing protein 8A isoform X3 [Brienomyrus brachyistius]|uniref:zinc finger and BTB domain-containing protein 8A isoform X3 n=1 Tax=Brienomyrus brachyistius TaxID=42636 RepID=UPI0020B3E0CA|nr:zinc finger and BTB domain-containing protein 8A isoform X3 [Brienomyrus brachyistius]
MSGMRTLTPPPRSMVPERQLTRTSGADMMAEHQSRLLQQLDEQRRQELFCDCHVLVEGQLFKAHRNVLFGSSGYFRMLLGRGGAECGRPVSATFEAFSADTFSVILDFVYSGRLDLTSVNVIEVMSAASYLQMNDVIGFCKGFIRSSLDISAKETADQCLSLPEESSTPEGVDHVPIAQVEICTEPKPEVSNLSQGLGAPLPRGRRRAPPSQPIKVEQMTDSTAYRVARGSARRRTWSSLPVGETTSIASQQGAPSSKAQKADELYATLPTIVGVVGVFNKDSSPSMRFKCPFCTHTVKRKADLKRHLRCHTGERPYPCEACSKRFTRLEHLRSHFETIHQARKLVCRKCKRHVTELSGRVVCEGTRRYRLCNECIQESGCEGLLIDTASSESALLMGMGEEDEDDKEKDWLMTDEDDLAVDSGTDLIIQEVDDSEEEQELQN